MRTRIAFLAGALTLALATVGLADPPPNPAPPPADQSDPPGTTAYMGQLRSLFASWDLNGDGFLDKAELAKAFRGADAKPYDSKKTSDAPATDTPADPKTAAKKPDYSEYPDYNFLVKLDQDGDGQISRAEFMSWARDYATQLQAHTDQETKVALLEAKMAAASTPKEVKAAEKELKKEQASLKKLEGEAAKEMKAFDKLMKQQLKHHK
jgi:hypothetical protein